MANKRAVLIGALMLLASALGLEALTRCNQYHEPAGDCTHICDFYNGGSYAGSVEWRGACD